MLSEIGEAVISGGNINSLRWADVNSWSQVTDQEITCGESEAMIYLSSVYVGQYIEAMNSGCPSPNVVTPKSSDLIESRFKGLFAMMRGSNG